MVLHITLRHVVPAIRRWGSVANFWAYPYERFMSFLARLIKQKKNIEANMCAAYTRNRTMQIVVNPDLDDIVRDVYGRLEILKVGPQVSLGQTELRFQAMPEKFEFTEEQTKALMSFLETNIPLEEKGHNQQVYANQVQKGVIIRGKEISCAMWESRKTACRTSHVLVHSAGRGGTTKWSGTVRHYVKVKVVGFHRARFFNLAYIEPHQQLFAHYTIQNPVRPFYLFDTHMPKPENKYVDVRHIQGPLALCTYYFWASNYKAVVPL